MSDHVLVGPFLTRAQAARRAHLSREDTRHRPDLLRLGGQWLEETYFSFQFDGSGIQPDIAHAVQSLKALAGDEAIADWLVRPNRHLQHSAPLGLLRSGADHGRVVAVAEADFGAGSPPAGPAPSPAGDSPGKPEALDDRRPAQREDLGLAPPAGRQLALAVVPRMPGDHPLHVARGQVAQARAEQVDERAGGDGGRQGPALVPHTGGDVHGDGGIGARRLADPRLRRRNE